MKLKSTKEITKQNWPEGTKPVVSVFNWTYNHIDYIKESIESILIQKTNFPVEIIIHDDASTDGTKEIILEYQEKYPQLFRNILHTENQWGQGKSIMKPLFEKPKGKYIALTHGDDYWTDPYKLQKQFDFLEKNKLCNYVFTNNSVLHSNGELKTINKNLDNLFDLKYLLKKRIMPPTLTLMFDKGLLINNIQWRHLIKKAFNVDWVLLFMLNQNSKIGFIKDNTGVYREGIGIVSNTNVIYKMKNGIETNKKLNTMTNFKYNEYLNDNRFNYSEISYYYAREKKFINSLGWFFKTEFHLITFHGIKSIMSDWNKRYIKNSFNIIFNRTTK